MLKSRPRSDVLSPVLLGGFRMALRLRTGSRQDMGRCIILLMTSDNVEMASEYRTASTSGIWFLTGLPADERFGVFCFTNMSMPRISESVL